MLQLQDVTTAYGDRTAVEHPSCDVPAGSLTGFVGANGAGKTTTMWVALGITELRDAVQPVGGRRVVLGQQPLQLLVLLPFFASVDVTDGIGQKVLSFVPFSAPLVMPQRLLAEDAELWEAGVSAAIMLVTAVALITLGSRLYKASLLRTRGRTSLKEALAATAS